MPPKPDVRRLLKKQQSERNKANKITHPFAKYDEAGRLVCVVCNAPVKSEAVWQAHLGSVVHRENIQKLKALKQQQQQQQQLKRRASTPPSSEPTDNYKRVRMEEESDSDKHDIELDEEVSDEDEDMGLPNDFFDNPHDDVPEEVPEQEVEEEANNALPTGFFDDPEEDARAQGHLAPEEQAQADLEKDIAMFNEAMIEVTKESREVQEEDDETFWVERHYDISQEQAAFDSRVEKLKQLRQGQDAAMAVDQKQEKVVDGDNDDDDIRIGLKSSVRQILKSKPAKKTESMFDDDDDDDDESDEEEDWRAQQL
jgi:zinc finger protein 830